jgi:hypothetical protein
MGRPAAEKSDIPLSVRIFSVCAAVLLVASLAMATLLPPDTSLHEAMHDIDATGADDVQHAMVGMLGKGVWEAVVVPFLLRPVWLVPLSLGLICVGGALTARFHARPHTKRKQS